MYRINLNFLYFSALIFITILFRLYNINYEDFWIDEIISFYVSDPSISFNEFVQRHKTLENSPFLFNFFLRIYFDIFGYDTSIARYLPATFNIFSVFLLVYFYKEIFKGRSVIFLFILLAFNIYIIKYSQELRLYSWYLLIFVINIFYFYKTVNYKKFETKINKYFFFISSIFLILTHPFSLIIVFCYSLFFIYLFFKEEKIPFDLILILGLINIFSIVFIISFISHTTHQPIWIESIDLKFFTNFFFSKFFGSRIIGGIYLIVIFFLIYKFLKDILYEKNLEFFLLLVAFFSYLIPIIYSYIFNPAVVDRYLIYLVLLFILLLTILIDKIQTPNRRVLLSIFLIFCTIGNFSTETTFKQFLNENRIHKPDLKSTLFKIKNSNNFEVTLNLENTYLSKNEISNAFQNYIRKYKKITNLQINYFNYKNKTIYEKQFWIICLNDLNGNDCSIPKKFSNYKVIEEESFNNINVKLIENSS